MGDQEIIELFWQRDEDAVAQSQRAYGAYCFTIAHNILMDREGAEECVNDTWLRAWNSMPPQRPGRLSAFFGRITRNLALDRYAAKRAYKRGGGEMELVLEELDHCIAAADTVGQAIDEAELARCINRFLHTLPARERNIFLCRYWDVSPLKDIATKYGLREANVKASLYRSREKLRAFLEKEGITV
ncbi:MAG: sigma-70 family RNA polymerase sigma factor [Syntrophomonadaceae bacterium]|nr:sigma-70 family RNA polymerase sigma factor [Syntrophomonadaceae bacterium]